MEQNQKEKSWAGLVQRYLLNRKTEVYGMSRKAEASTRDPAYKQAKN